jgi:DNA-binding NarL/FixJ family response regulator
MLAAPSLLIVDDHPLFTDGLVQLLARSHPDMRVGCASSSNEALQMLRMRGYDIVLADWKLADGNGLALLAQVAQIDPTVVRLLCSGADEHHLAQQARTAGLMGFLPKALSPREFGAALNQVIAGQPWFPSPSMPSVRLTQRQLSILQLAASGAPNKTIARNLDITERTVKFHLAAAFVRLGTKKRTEAVTRAVQLGMIALPASTS